MIRNSRLFGPLFFVVAAICANPAAATVINYDFMVDTSQSQVRNFTRDSYYLLNNYTDTSWFNISQKDTFSGLVKFGDGKTFVSNSFPAMSAQFLFSPSPYGITYSAWIETWLVDDTGKELNYYKRVDNSTNGAFNIFTTGDSVARGNIAGMKFKVKFDGLLDRSSSNPISMRLSYVSFGPYSRMVSPVPEPSTWATMMLGVTGIGLMMRRRRATVSAALA